jgi:protein-S-isoprenylcysteine O-methyltransferase Ste14
MRPFSGNKVQSWTLVLVQFICLILLFTTGPLLARNPIFLVIEIISLAIGFWAMFLMDPLTINIFPEVRKEASFVKYGPYRFIRHPMYLALILLSFSLLLEKFTILRLFICLVLLINLLIKIGYEEKILASNYPGYKQYQQGTKKLFPFIY